jgi:RNA polymerase sigma-70 factor (ECF subfamily)
MSDAPPADIGNFSEISRRHEAYLHRVALQLSGLRDVANDLVQETLARGLLHFARFEQGTNARAWLTTILTRLFLDHLKRERVIARALPKLVTSEVVDSNIEIAILVKRDADVRAAIQRLEPDLREVIDCCYMQDMSYKEIADKLKIPLGTVSTRLLRARLRLKELLTVLEGVTG